MQRNCETDGGERAQGFNPTGGERAQGFNPTGGERVQGFNPTGGGAFKHMLSKPEVMRLVFQKVRELQSLHQGRPFSLGSTLYTLTFGNN